MLYPAGLRMSGNQGVWAWLEIRFAHCLEKNVPVRNPDLSPPIEPAGHSPPTPWNVTIAVVAWVAFKRGLS